MPDAPSVAPDATTSDSPRGSATWCHIFGSSRCSRIRSSCDGRSASSSAAAGSATVWRPPSSTVAACATIAASDALNATSPATPSATAAHTDVGSRCAAWQRTASAGRLMGYAARASRRATLASRAMAVVSRTTARAARRSPLTTFHHLTSSRAFSNARRSRRRSRMASRWFLLASLRALRASSLRASALRSAAAFQAAAGPARGFPTASSPRLTAALAYSIRSVRDVPAAASFSARLGMMSGVSNKSDSMGLPLSRLWLPSHCSTGLPRPDRARSEARSDAVRRTVPRVRTSQFAVLCRGWMGPLPFGPLEPSYLRAQGCIPGCNMRKGPRECNPGAFPDPANVQQDRSVLPTRLW